MLRDRKCLELFLLFSLSCVAALALVVAGRFDLSTGYRSVVLYDEQFKHLNSTEQSKLKKVQGDWDVKPNGFGLAPGGAGIIIVRIKNQHQGQFLVQLKGHGGNGLHIALSISEDGLTFREVARETSLNGKLIDLTPTVDRLDQVWIKLVAVADSDSPPSEPAVLKGLRVFVRKPPIQFPNLPIAALIILAPLLAYMTRSTTQPKGAMAYSFSILCGLVMMAEVNAHTLDRNSPQWWRLVMASEHDGYFILPYFVLLGLLGWRLQIGRGSSAQQEAKWVGFALSGVLAWGAHSRLTEVAQRTSGPLDPDAITYLELAQRMSSLYDTDSREPLWIWMIRGWSWFVGDSALHLRLFTLLMSLLVIVIAYKFFRDYTGVPLIGVAVAGLLAVNPYLIYSSVRGLREETYTIAILSVAYCVFVPSGKMSPLRRGIGLAFATAAAQLLRFNSYLFIIPLVSLWSWRHHRSLLHAVLPLVFTIAVSVPHLIHNYRVFDDPLYSLNHMAIWSRNYEFVILKKTGCQGCPTQEEFFENGYAGSKIGTFGYLIGMHTVQELATGMVNGLLDMYVKPTALFHILSGTSSSLSYGLYLVGLGLVLFGPYREILIVILLTINVVPFFMSMGLEGRLAVHTTPFVSFILVYGLWWVCARWLGCPETAALTVPAWRLAGALRPVLGAKTTRSFERSS